jgi:hypothetical protein
MNRLSSASGQRPGRLPVKENPRRVLCGSLRAKPAILVVRQLPTNHDHDGECSHSIHEYQSDQPSRIAASAAAHWRWMTRHKIRHRLVASLDGSLHIRTLTSGSQAAQTRTERVMGIEHTYVAPPKRRANQLPVLGRAVCDRRVKIDVTAGNRRQPKAPRGIGSSAVCPA